MRHPLNPTEKQKIELSSINKVLLVRLRRIGDVVMTTPAITALRKALPSAHISYVIETPYRELIEGNPHVDKVIVLPRPMGKKRFMNTVRLLRKERFDVAIDFHGGPTASLITFLSGARQKIGYRIKYKSFAYDISLPRSLESSLNHSVENHIRLVQAMGIEVPEPPPLLLPEPSESDKKKIHAFLSDNHLQDSKVVVIHVGAGNEFRWWGIDNWASLVSSLVKHQGAKIVLIGASEDEKNADQILSGHPESVFSQVGRLNLKELKEMIAKATLYIGPDSGPMHIAASTPTPIVALFGPNLSAYNAPWQTKATIIEKELDCRPCDQRNCISGDFRCMRRITAKEIYGACLPYLDHS
jgi:heptosyltransferase-1